MNNVPKMKVGIVAVSRDCFPESLSVNRRKALVDAYSKKYDAADIYECPILLRWKKVQHMAGQFLQPLQMEYLQVWKMLLPRLSELKIQQSQSLSW